MVTCDRPSVVRVVPHEKSTELWEVCQRAETPLNLIIKYIFSCQFFIFSSTLRKAKRKRFEMKKNCKKKIKHGVGYIYEK